MADWLAAGKGPQYAGPGNLYQPRDIGSKARLRSGLPTTARAESARRSDLVFAAASQSHRDSRLLLAQAYVRGRIKNAGNEYWLLGDEDRNVARDRELMPQVVILVLSVQVERSYSYQVRTRDTASCR